MRRSNAMNARTVRSVREVDVDGEFSGVRLEFSGYTNVAEKAPILIKRATFGLRSARFVSRFVHYQHEIVDRT